MSLAEQIYDIYDKELLNMVLAFQDWWVYLEWFLHPIKMIFDYKNLEYFLTTKQLNWWQARWFEFLSTFDFNIQHWPGLLNGRTDVLSKKINVMEGRTEENWLVLWLVALESCELVWSNLHILGRLKISMEEDPNLEPILSFFKNNSNCTSTDICCRLQDYTFDNGILRFHNMIYVPNDEELQRQILWSWHDALAIGH